MFAQHAGMDGHVVHALLGLLFNDFQHEAEGQVLWTTHAGNRFVDRDGANRNGRSINNGFADFGDVAAGGKVHHGVGAIMYGVVQLLQFFVNVGGRGRIADVGVDLAFAGDADAHGFQVAVVHIGGNNQAAASDFAADQFGVDLLAPSYKAHLFGDYAATRPVHLRHIAVAVRRRMIAVSFSAPLIPKRHNSPSETLA